MKPLRIGQVAKRAGVGVETIRFYEREGLIPEPARRPSGYRQYQPDAVRRVRFIRGARELGFSLKEIKELLALHLGDDASCEDVRLTAANKVRDIDARIAQLAAIREVLTGLVEACPGTGPTEDCPILGAIDAPTDPEPLQ